MMTVRVNSTKGSLAAEKYKTERAEVTITNKLYSDNDDFKGIHEEMRMIEALNTRATKKRLEMVVSFAPGTKLIDKEETILKHLATELGYSKNQWRAVKHTDTGIPHWHITVNRVGFDKKLLNDSFIGKRAQETLDKVTKKFNLKTPKEVTKAKAKRYYDDLISCTKATSMADFEAQLNAKGYHLEISRKKDGSLNGGRLMTFEERDRNYDNPMFRNKKKPAKGLKFSQIKRSLKVQELQNHFDKIAAKRKVEAEKITKPDAEKKANIKTENVENKPRRKRRGPRR